MDLPGILKIEAIGVIAHSLLPAISRRLPGVAYTDRNILARAAGAADREFQDVGKGRYTSTRAQCGGQGGIQRRILRHQRIRRKETERPLKNARPTAVIAEILPVTAEVDAVTALAQRYVFIQLKGARDSVLGDVVIVSDRHPEATDPRPVQVEAVEWVTTLGRIRGTQLVAEDRIGNPKLIHQAWIEYAGHTHICLIRMVVARCPGGFQVTAARKVGVSVQAVADIEVVIVVELVIQPGVEQLASER